MMIFARALSMLALLAGLAGLTTGITAGLAMLGLWMVSGTFDVLAPILIAALGMSSWVLGIRLANFAYRSGSRRHSDHLSAQVAEDHSIHELRKETKASTLEPYPSVTVHEELKKVND